MELKRDEEGQLSLYDALIYFTFLLIATTVLFFYSTEMRQSQEFMRSENVNTYCQETRVSLMRATVQETEYIDTNGKRIVRENISVESLLLEELYLRDEGIKEGNISYSEDIRNLTDNLIRGRYNWVIASEYKDLSVIIGNYEEDHETREEALDSLSGSVYSSSWSEPMIKGKEGNVEMSFYISEIWD